MRCAASLHAVSDWPVIWKVQRIFLGAMVVVLVGGVQGGRTGEVYDESTVLWEDAGEGKEMRSAGDDVLL